MEVHSSIIVYQNNSIMIDNLNLSENSGLLVVGSLLAVAALIGGHFVLSIILKSFKRDGSKSFSSLSDLAYLLSNNDSVLSHSGVEDSVANYEKLYSGAREDIGTTSTADSINKREREYATMVNSFYDLVTDFYEWGWGEVSANKSFNFFTEIHVPKAHLDLA